MGLSRITDSVLPNLLESDISCGVSSFRAAGQHLLAATPLDQITDPYVRRIVDSARDAYEKLKPGGLLAAASSPGGVKKWHIETVNRTSIGTVMRLLNNTLDSRLEGIARRIKEIYDNADKEGMLSALETPTADFSLVQLARGNVLPTALTNVNDAYALLRRVDNGFKADCGIATSLATQVRTLIDLGAMRATPRTMGEIGIALAQIFETLTKTPELFNGLVNKYDAPKYDGGYDFFSHTVQTGLPSSKPLTTTGLPSNLVPDDSTRVLAGQDPVLWLPRSRLITRTEELRTEQDRFKQKDFSIGMINAGRILDYLAQIDMNEGTATAVGLFNDGAPGSKTFLQTASKLRMSQGQLDAYIVIDETGISISPLTREIILKIANGTYQAFTPLELKLTPEY